TSSSSRASPTRATARAPSGASSARRRPRSGAPSAAGRARAPRKRGSRRRARRRASSRAPRPAPAGSFGMIVFSWFAALLGSVVCLQAPARELVLRDVRVVDVERGVALPERALLVRDGRIEAIAPAHELAVPAGAEVVEGQGRTLIPGLVDAHVHLYPEHDVDDLWLYLAHGVTTVRSMHGGRYQLGVRERVRKGELVGPRVL